MFDPKTLPPPDFPVYRINGQVRIQADHDKAFREALLLHARRVDPQVAAVVAEALSGAPSTTAETNRFYGNELPVILAATSALTEELETAIPGIGRWLNATGFGNCYRLIGAFKLWVDTVLARYPRGINSDQLQ